MKISNRSTQWILLAFFLMPFAMRAAEIVNPAFLVNHPSRRFLYTVGDIPDSSGKKIGTVSAFAIDSKTGTLNLLNSVPDCGSDPTFVYTRPRS